MATCPGYAPVAEPDAEADLDAENEEASLAVPRPKIAAEVPLVAICPAWWPDAQPFLRFVDPAVENPTTDQPEKLFIATCPADPFEVETGTGVAGEVSTARYAGNFPTTTIPRGNL
ncbi:MAG: hypothetical protein ABIZ49_04405, partial [Opitutaceae bacterium]